MVYVAIAKRIIACKQIQSGAPETMNFLFEVWLKLPFFKPSIRSLMNVRANGNSLSKYANILRSCNVKYKADNVTLEGTLDQFFDKGF